MSRTRRAQLAIVLLGAFMGLAACDSSDPTSLDDTGNVTEAGGAVTSSDGKVKLEVPAGAVTGNVQITIAPVTSPPASEGLVSGSAYEFGPSGLTFAQPVDMAIQVPSGVIPADAPRVTAALHRRTGSQWVRVPGSQADASGQNVHGKVTSFSVYAVIFLGLPSEVVMGGESQSVPVGAEVPVRPSVVVRSSTGAPLEGLEVNFSVASGDGSVSGATQTTDGEGRAVVGGWTVGTTPGPNTLTATIEGMDTPVVFEAQAVPGDPAALEKLQGDEQTAPSGSDVSIAPRVKVTDAFGNLLEGVTVSFEAGQGGSVSPASAATDASGEAGVTTWRLGDPGANTLRASVASGASVEFTASATAGPPAAITFQAGEGQSAFPGKPLDQPPTVRVTDAQGFASPDATVTFSADRNGTVAQATAVTDTEGRASPGSWTLGDRPFTDPRVNTLTAEIAGVSPVTLTAEVLDPCTQSWPTAAFGSEVSGTLVPGRSCVAASGRLIQRFAVDFPDVPVVRLQVNSEEFPAFLGSNEPSSDRQLAGWGSSTVGGLETEVIFPPGTYLVTAGTPTQDPTNPTLGGSFTLSTGASEEPQVGCIPTTAVTSGSVATGNITSDDCDSNVTSEKRWDGYSILLQAGQTVTVVVTGSVLYDATYWTGGAYQFGFHDVAAGQSQTFTITAEATSFHSFFMIQPFALGGSYTMSFSVTEPSGAPARDEGNSNLIELMEFLHRGGMRGR